MKRKILSILLIAVMLLSAIAGLAGCGESGFASTKITADKGTEIGKKPVKNTVPSTSVSHPRHQIKTLISNHFMLFWKGIA